MAAPTQSASALYPSYLQGFATHTPNFSLQELRHSPERRGDCRDLKNPSLDINTIATNWLAQNSWLMFTQMYIAQLKKIGCESCEIVNPSGTIRELREKAKETQILQTLKRTGKKCFKKNQEGHSAPA